MLNCETSKKENMELKQKVEDETRTANPVIDKPEQTGISKKSETGETKPKIIKAQQTDKKVSLSKLVPIGIKETILLHSWWQGMKDTRGGRNMNTTTLKNSGVKSGLILYGPSGFETEKGSCKPLAVIEFNKTGEGIGVRILDTVLFEKLGGEKMDLDNSSIALQTKKPLKTSETNYSKKGFTHGWMFYRLKRTKSINAKFGKIKK